MDGELMRTSECEHGAVGRCDQCIENERDALRERLLVLENRETEAIGFLRKKLIAAESRVAELEVDLHEAERVRMTAERELAQTTEQLRAQIGRANDARQKQSTAEVACAAVWAACYEATLGRCHGVGCCSDAIRALSSSAGAALLRRLQAAEEVVEYATRLNQAYLKSHDLNDHDSIVGRVALNDVLRAYEEAAKK